MHYIHKALSEAWDKKRVYLSNEFVADLNWWRKCLTSNNGISIDDQEQKNITVNDV